MTALALEIVTTRGLCALIYSIENPTRRRDKLVALRGAGIHPLDACLITPVAKTLNHVSLTEARDQQITV